MHADASLSLSAEAWTSVSPWLEVLETWEERTAIQHAAAVEQGVRRRHGLAYICCRHVILYCIGRPSFLELNREMSSDGVASKICLAKTYSRDAHVYLGLKEFCQAVCSGWRLSRRRRRESQDGCV